MYIGKGLGLDPSEFEIPQPRSFWIWDPPRLVNCQFLASPLMRTSSSLKMFKNPEKGVLLNLKMWKNQNLRLWDFENFSKKLEQADLAWQFSLSNQAHCQWLIVPKRLHSSQGLTPSTGICFDDWLTLQYCFWGPP